MKATTLAVWLATFGLVFAAGTFTDTPVYVHDAAPAGHGGYVGLTCPKGSGWHPLCQAGPVPHTNVYAGGINTPAEAAMVAWHEDYHNRFPSMPESAAWRSGCFRSWVERWCGDRAFRGGTR